MDIDRKGTVFGNNVTSAESQATRNEKYRSKAKPENGRGYTSTTHVRFTEEAPGNETQTQEDAKSTK